MASLARPIFLLTDWGLRDSYVGQAKAVMATISPASALIDLTHEVEPWAIDEAAWLLETSLSVLPADAVVLAVVDPGVGTGRRALVIQAGERTFVGPDNGIFSGAADAISGKRQPGGEGAARLKLDSLDGVDVRELCEPSLMRRQVSHTFHGRDVFAPAAAYIAAGADYRRAGPPLSEILALPAFRGRPAGNDTLEGEVIHVDRFGTLITTILAEQLFPRFAIELGGRVVETQVRTFAEAQRGDLFCHVDSSGYIAIAMNLGSAAGQLGVRRGEVLRVRRR